MNYRELLNEISYEYTKILKDNLVPAKKDGGQWGIKNLPYIYSTIVEAAQRCYITKENFSADEKFLQNFAEYMLEQIFSIGCYNYSIS